MTTQRRLILLLATIVTAAAVGGLVYTRNRGPAPNDTQSTANDTQSTAPVTNATTPTRPLNEKERMLVGKWKLERATPKKPTPQFEATSEYAPDGTWTHWTSDELIGPQVQHGTFRLVGDTLISTLEGQPTTAVLIEELTDSRLVMSNPNGGTLFVLDWSRVRM